MKVHFLRHAESIFNRDLISEKDCALTEKGVEQASQVGGQYDIVVCSIMKRTCQTLENSKLTYGRLIFTDLCREKKTTICDYLPHEDESLVDTDEQLEQQIERFTYFLKSQVSRYNNVLVVSHGDFIHAIGKKSQPYPNNAEIQIHEI
jgi:broad specificity phosphatase PhoE